MGYPSNKPQCVIDARWLFATLTRMLSMVVTFVRKGSMNAPPKFRLAAESQSIVNTDCRFRLRLGTKPEDESIAALAMDISSVARSAFARLAFKVSI